MVGQELDWLLSESESEGTAEAAGSNWSRAAATPRAEPHRLPGHHKERERDTLDRHDARVAG